MRTALGDDMLPEIKISTYGIAVVAGLIACISNIVLRKNKYGYNNRVLAVCSGIILCFMALGSKILFFLTQLPLVLKEFSFIKTIEIFITSGFVYYGGFLGALVGIIFAAKLLNIDTLQLMNFCAPLFAVFHAFGRIGCFMAGCCYGIPWKYGFAMIDTPDVNRFPVQLLEAFLEFFLFFLLLHIEKEEKYDLMKIYMVIYAIMRFFLEYLRGDDIRGIWVLGLSTSQLIALCILVVWLFRTMRYIYLRKHKSINT